MIEKVFRVYKDNNPREEVYREGTLKVSAPIKRIIRSPQFVYYERYFVKAFKKTSIIYKQALILPNLSIRISKLYTKQFHLYRNYKFYIDIGKINNYRHYIEFKDLFLDIIEFTNGQKIIEDREELEEALKKDWITKEEYNHAKTVLTEIWKRIQDIPIEEFIKEIVDIQRYNMFIAPTRLKNKGEGTYLPLW